MRPPRAVDYDQGDLHRGYAVGRALQPQQVALWTELLAEAVGAGSPRRILDLGCGVGRFSGLLRDRFGAAVLGLDRSERMLAAAAGDPGLRAIRWLRGEAEALPLRAGAVDLVFLFLLYHHVLDGRGTLGECARVLAPSGRVLLVNSTVEALDSYVWLPFFPSAREIDLARLPSRAGLVRAAAEAGLRRVWHRVVANPVAPTLRAYADRIASRTISTLCLVSDDEFARGAADFRRYAEREDRGQPVHDVIDVFVLERR